MLKFAWTMVFLLGQVGPDGAKDSRGMTPLPDAEGKAILAKSAEAFPKFHAVYEDAVAHDKLLRRVVMVRSEGQGQGPAFAGPNGVIRIDVGYLEHPRPTFDDNRMVVVLEHELGHLHYFQTTARADWTPENSEKAAFEYSLKMTKAMAEKGDCAPLQAGLKFMKMRSEGTNLGDAHVRALKRMVNEPMYAEYVKWDAEKCKATAAPE